MDCKGTWKRSKECLFRDIPGTNALGCLQRWGTQTWDCWEAALTGTLQLCFHRGTTRMPACSRTLIARESWPSPGLDTHCRQLCFVKERQFWELRSEVGIDVDHWESDTALELMEGDLKILWCQEGMQTNCRQGQSCMPLAMLL